MPDKDWRQKHPNYVRRYNKLYQMGYRRQVAALGSQRRIQALQAIGYTIPELAAETGLSEHFIWWLSSGRGERLDGGRAQRISQVYDELSARPRHDTASARKARAWAKKKRLAPPMAWTDIDNPDDRPRGTVHTITWRQHT